MTDLLSGQVDLLVVQAAVVAAAGARRHDQGDRQPVAAALGLDAGHSDLGRGRRAGLLHVGLVRLLRAQGHAEGRRSPSSMPRWSQALADPAVKARFTELGLDVASARAADAATGSPRSTRPRSTSGGRSSRPPTSRNSEPALSLIFWECDMRTLWVALRFRVGGRHRCAGAGLSDAADHRGGAVPGRRADRRHHAQSRRAHAGLARPAAGGRIRHRRRRLASAPAASRAPRPTATPSSADISAPTPPTVRSISCTTIW